VESYFPSFFPTDGGRIQLWPGQHGCIKVINGLLLGTQLHYSQRKTSRAKVQENRTDWSLKIHNKRTRLSSI